MRRLMKYLLVGVWGLLAVLVSLIAVNYFFPKTYEADAELPGTTSRVIVQLQPMHLYLAEYRRALILRRPGAPDQRLDMFPDTGGYSRTQLYHLNNERFLVKGFFDSFVVDAKAHSLSKAPADSIGQSTYLGAFDDTGDGRWRFIATSELPEKRLKVSN